MTVLESLKEINPYPIPSKKIQVIALKRGLSLESEATKEILLSAAYRLCEADLYSFLATVPYVSQQSVGFTLTDGEKARFEKIASDIYDQLGETDVAGKKVVYGYKGSNL